MLAQIIKNIKFVNINFHAQAYNNYYIRPYIECQQMHQIDAVNFCGQKKTIN